MEITNKVVANAVAARNAGGEFVQYTTDSFIHVPKVGEEYRHNGKLVKCTAVTRLAAGAGGIDRYLVEGRVVNAVAARNATMGEIKAQLNPAKVKEAYQQLKKAADGLERCIPALKASNIAKAWPRMAEMYGEARSKLNDLMMQFEGELQDMIR